jgi:hypothetical protein
MASKNAQAEEVQQRINSITEILASGVVRSEHEGLGATTYRSARSLENSLAEAKRERDGLQGKPRQRQVLLSVRPAL